MMSIHRPCISADSEAGFTLVEFAAVIAIIGVLLAVIVPRAQRARVEAKYQVLRQNCTELASWANEWSMRELESQGNWVTSNLNDYMQTLGGSAAGTRTWVGENDASNWNNTGAKIDINGRKKSATDNTLTPPNTTVYDLTPPTNALKNPFNGTSVFNTKNDPGDTGIIPGAIACTWQNDTSISANHRYYAFIFMGVDSTENTEFHAGQGTDLAGLRNGVFITGIEQ